MERMTSWSLSTADADDDNKDGDDRTTSSVRQLIDVIVKSEHPQTPSRWNFVDVHQQLPSNETSLQVGMGWTDVFLL